MKYESQRVAWWFFATCMLLFGLQLVYGLIMAYAHAGHDPLHPIIPFNVARAVHTNLLVVWLLTGFMGAAYFIVPEEADRELYWPKLAYVQLIALVAVGVTAIIGFHLQWWEGRRFLELPRPLDFLEVLARTRVTIPGSELRALTRWERPLSSSPASSSAARARSVPSMKRRPFRSWAARRP